MAEWSGGGGGDFSDDFAAGGGITKGRSGRRKHWKLPDMIQGVRHRFRDRLAGGGAAAGRSKSPDSTLDEGVDLRGSQTSVYRMAAKETLTTTTYTSFASTTSLPRAASLLSTDYGFNDWGGLESLPPSGGGINHVNSQLPPTGGHPPGGYQPPTRPPLANINPLNSTGSGTTTTIAVHRQGGGGPTNSSQPAGGYNHGLVGGQLSSFLGENSYPAYPQHRPPAASRRLPGAAPASGGSATPTAANYLTRNNSFGASSSSIRPQPTGGIPAIPVAVARQPTPAAALGRTMSVNLVNHVGLADGYSDLIADGGGCDPAAYRNGGVGLPIDGSGSIPRGNKSVRFGENRISVFLQDSTQALEECVRLALSYAEESQAVNRGSSSSGGGGGGDYCSDSEAVILSRQLNAARSNNNNYPSGDDPTTLLLSQQRPGGRQFWSDSEERVSNTEETARRRPVDLPPTDRGFSLPAASPSSGSGRRTGGAAGIPDSSNRSNGFNSGGGGGCGDELQATPTTDFRPKLLFGQAVNSLDRGVERSTSADKQRRRQRQRSTTTHINEIFSFIDKVLSGCENGCSDEACPMARHRKVSSTAANAEDGGDVRRYGVGGGSSRLGYPFPDRPMPHLEVSETCRPKCLLGY
jgi:hypothetical protein